MSKIKDFYRKHEELIRYFVFGLITMIVSFAIFYLTLWVATSFFDALRDGKNSSRYLTANIVANILKWCSGVLVAFYTSKKWVFKHADNSVSTGKQLLIFAEGRVLTLIMSLILQYLLELLFTVVFVRDVTVLGIVISAATLGTTAALIIYSVIEVIANYFFSKKIVFKSKQD